MNMKRQPIDSSVVQSCYPASMASCRAVALRCLLTFLVVAAFARSAPAVSPVSAETNRLLEQVEPRIKAIYEANEFATRSFGATWLPDGSGYLKLETPAGASARKSSTTTPPAANARSWLPVRNYSYPAATSA